MNEITTLNATTIVIVCALAGVVILAAALVKWHKAIIGAIGKACKALFTFNGFFWIVNLACMAYSAQNAGYVFGLYEASGFLVGIALDGLIIVFTQTALAAKARGEMRRATLILLFIVFCCLLSTIGNLAHNLHTDITAQTSGVWFQETIPYVTSLMPLLLIALAWVADLKIDPLEKENPEVYQANEQKRLQFQTIQIESREKQEALQSRAIAVEVLRRRNAALRRGKTPGSFRWFWEKAVDAGEIIAGLSAQLQPLFGSQVEEIKRELVALRKEKEEFLIGLEQVHSEKMMEFQRGCEDFITQLIDQVRGDLFTQSEQYRVALQQQYGQDIAMVKDQLSGQIETALSDLKMTISQDVNLLKEELNDSIIIAQKSAKLSTVISMTPEIEEVVKRYPNVASWLSRGERSVTLQDIIDATGHTSQLIHRRAKAGAFRATKRTGYYRLDSVLSWLKTAPLPRPKEEGKQEEISLIEMTKNLPNTDQIEAVSQENDVPNTSDNETFFDEEMVLETLVSGETQVVLQQDMVTNTSGKATLSEREETSESLSSNGKTGDKLAMTLAAMRENLAITDEELMVILSLKRPASARFWKVKAQTMLAQERQVQEPLELATV